MISAYPRDRWINLEQGRIPARMVTLDVRVLKTIFNFKMYVCVCEAVTDHEVRKLVEGGVSSVSEVMRCTRAGTRCGSCRSELAEVVASAQTGCRRRLEMLDARAEQPKQAA